MLHKPCGNIKEPRDVSEPLVWHEECMRVSSAHGIVAGPWGRPLKPDWKVSLLWEREYKERCGNKRPGYLLQPFRAPLCPSSSISASKAVLKAEWAVGRSCQIRFTLTKQSGFHSSLTWGFWRPGNQICELVSHHSVSGLPHPTHITKPSLLSHVNADVWEANFLPNNRASLNHVWYPTNRVWKKST